MPNYVKDFPISAFTTDITQTRKQVSRQTDEHGSTDLGFDADQKHKFFIESPSPPFWALQKG